MECPFCFYELSCLPEGSGCPECGRPRDEITIEQNYRAWRRRAIPLWLRCVVWGYGTWMVALPVIHFAVFLLVSYRTVRRSVYPETLGWCYFSGLAVGVLLTLILILEWPRASRIVTAIVVVGAVLGALMPAMM